MKLSTQIGVLEGHFEYLPRGKNNPNFGRMIQFDNVLDFAQHHQFRLQINENLRHPLPVNLEDDSWRLNTGYSQAGLSH